MNTLDERLLMATVHGSHLYGLQRPDSDLDSYNIIANEPLESHQTRIKGKQSIEDRDDVFVVTLSEFMLKANAGVPQALEAMFSQRASFDLLEAFRSAYRVNTPTFVVTYRRTILNFARLGLENETAKELLAPSYAEEVSMKRVRESVAMAKPRRVQRNGLEKYRKHSLRLLLNLEEGLDHGRFNPTLSDAGRDFVLNSMELPDLEFARLIDRRLAY